MSIRSHNFANPHIAGTLEDIEGNVRINYGYNSGGYERHAYFVTADGDVLSVDTVIAEIDKVDFNDPDDKSWNVIGVEVNYEDHDLWDAHSGSRIEAAYGEDN